MTDTTFTTKSGTTLVLSSINYVQPVKPRISDAHGLEHYYDISVGTGGEVVTEYVRRSSFHSGSPILATDESAFDEAVTELIAERNKLASLVIAAKKVPSAKDFKLFVFAGPRFEKQTPLVLEFSDKDAADLAYDKMFALHAKGGESCTPTKLY